MIQEASEIKSPITGGPVTLEWEWREMIFRKEKFRVAFPFYKCTDTGEQFTTTQSDAVWYTQLHNQYCYKYGIPYLDEIIGLRKQYGLSASLMAKILGFGPNQWRMYEQEEIPSVSNGRMIRAIMNPSVLLDIVKSARNALTEKEYVKSVTHINALPENANSNDATPCNAAIFSTPRGPENGFAPQSLFRLKNIMLFILQHSNNIGIETMQTLLYNIDYCSLRKRGMALTGLCIQKCDSTGTGNQMELLSVLRDEISWQPSTEDNPAVIVLTPNATSDMSIFNEDEMAVINCALTNPDRKLPHYPFDFRSSFE